MFQSFSRNSRSVMRLSVFWIFSLMGLVHSAHAQVGALLHLDTDANNSKSNQSRVWFHDGKWWAIAHDEPGNADYIWRHDGGGLWTRTSTKLEKGAQNRYDVIMDSPAGEVAILRSHTKEAKFWRYEYDSGSWSKIVSATIDTFGNADNGNPLSMARANNGDFWIFRVDTTKLQAKKSTDGGDTWSATINLKTPLQTDKGTTAAVTFTSGGQNYVGVAYGEIGTPGVNTVFGFLYHRDGDADNVWTDETSALTYFGAERGANTLSMAVDPANNVYLFTRNFGGGGGDPRNTLYKRTGSNTWANYNVNTVSGFNWNSPALAIDTTNNLLLVSGIRTDSSFAEYKYIALGNESALGSAPRNLLMQNGAEIFEHVSVPRQYLNSIDGMMTTVGNTTENSTWFNLVFPSATAPIAIDSVAVVSNEVNANGRYTIPIVLADTANGTLAAGLGKIFIRFPSTTLVPASIAAGNVSVNGIIASAVTTNPAFLEVTITTPVAVPGGDTVIVVIDSLANVINPQKIGFDSLWAWTSKQPTPVSSPRYALVRATTKVAPAFVTLIPTDPDSAATYTLQFNLGDQGRTAAGADTLAFCFNPKTGVTQGALPGVTVNFFPAAASGDSTTRCVSIIVPAGLNLLNNDSVKVNLPASALTNPDSAGYYKLFVSTSVETTKVESLPYEIAVSVNCGLPINGTFDNFSKGNQNKTFYHGGFWWLVAPSFLDKNWYLWKFDGLVWTQGILISDAPKSRPDVWRQASNSKVYILLPGGSTTLLSRLSYSGGNWSIDSGYPKTVNNVQNDVMNLVRAKNGHLWVFWMADSTLRAQRSGNEGTTWTAVINIKSGLNEDEGLTDAVALKIGGGNGIGVGYAEDSGVPDARFGFLYHKDGEGDNVWTDETSSLPVFTNTTADDHIAMATHNNQVFMIVKTKGGGSNTIKNAVYHRKANGAWARYTVIQGNGWTRPVVTVDITNKVLYVLGTREGTSRNVEMKRVKFGSFTNLFTAPIDTVFCDSTDSFFDVTLPAHNLNGNMGLMVVANNQTENGLWYRRLLLGALPKTAGDDFEEEQEAELAGAIDDYKLVAEVYPNPFNPRTTIRFQLREAAPVRLQIFNISGQLVRTLVDNDMPAGMHQRHWNARNHSGEPVASGVYIYRLQVGARLATGQMQLLK